MIDEMHEGRESNERCHSCGCSSPKLSRPKSRCSSTLDEAKHGG